MNKRNSYNKSNRGQQRRPKGVGIDPSDIEARLNRIYGNLQTAASPSEVLVYRRPWRNYTPHDTELEIEERRRQRERSNNFQEDSKDKEEDNDNGSGSGKKKEEKVQKKVGFIGVACICSECGNSHISGDNAETGQDQASSSTKNRKPTWEQWVASQVPDN